MIVFQMLKKEELMINMDQKNLNNIINIIGNIMEKVLQNKFLEHFLNKMEDLIAFLVEI